jgi:hypothetical protein
MTALGARQLDPQECGEVALNGGRTSSLAAELRGYDDRMPGEPSRAFAHYTAYRDAGAVRSIAKTAREHHVDTRWLRRLSARWSWVERAGRYDAWRDAISLDAQAALARAAAVLAARRRWPDAAVAEAPDTPEVSPAKQRDRDGARERMRRLRASRRNELARAHPSDTWSPDLGVPLEEWLKHRRQGAV